MSLHSTSEATTPKLTRISPQYESKKLVLPQTMHIIIIKIELKYCDAASTVFFDCLSPSTNL